MNQQCTLAQDTLRRKWADHDCCLSTSSPARDSRDEPFALDTARTGTDDASSGSVEDWLAAHLSSCTQCKLEATELELLDSVFSRGFFGLEGFVGPPSQQIVEGTIRRLREQAPEIQIIRRIRRPLRMILWGVFYAFTLLASCVLAVALYRALKGV